MNHLIIIEQDDLQSEKLISFTAFDNRIFIEAKLAEKTFFLEKCKN